MNKRRKLIVALGAGALTAPLSSFAQQQAKIPRIGWLGARPAESAGGLDRLRRELGALGHVEGKNISFEPRYADNKLDRLPALAQELIDLKIDILVAAAFTEAVAARDATKIIPIVFFGTGDPVAIGLVQSLARPGGNITGFTSITTMLAGKRLELLKETVPKVSRVAVLWMPENPSSAQEREETQLAAQKLGLRLQLIELRGASKIEDAFKEATKAHSTALAVSSSPLVNSNQNQIARLAAKHRLPTIYNRGDAVANGGLMSYGADQLEPYRRGAVLVDKLLKGAKPANLPVEQPTKFELVINLKTARQIGLTIPPSILARVDKVIE